MKKHVKKFPWPLILLLQWILSFLAGAICTLLPLLLPRHTTAVFLAFYCIMPLCGAALSFFSVRFGLMALAAWPAPVIAFIAAHAIFVGTFPTAGSAITLFLLAILGAAAGETVNQRK